MSGREDQYRLVSLAFLELFSASPDQDCSGLVGTKSKHHNQRSRERFRNEYTVIVAPVPGSRYDRETLGKSLTLYWSRKNNVDDLIAGLKWLAGYWAVFVGAGATAAAWFRYGKRHCVRVVRTVALSDRLHERFGHTEANKLAEDIHGSHIDGAVREVRVALLERRASAAIYVCNSVTGECTYANSELAELFGMEAADFSGNGWLSAIDSKERGEVWKLWQSAVREHIPYECEYNVTNQRTGDQFRCITKAYPAKLKTGQVVWYVGTVERIEE